MLIFEKCMKYYVDYNKIRYTFNNDFKGAKEFAVSVNKPVMSIYGIEWSYESFRKPIKTLKKHEK